MTLSTPELRLARGSGVFLSLPCRLFPQAGERRRSRCRPALRLFARCVAAAETLAITV